jgi:hypothetical protein
LVTLSPLHPESNLVDADSVSVFFVVVSSVMALIGKAERDNLQRKEVNVFAVCIPSLVHGWLASHRIDD